MRRVPTPRSVCRAAMILAAIAIAAGPPAAAQEPVQIPQQPEPRVRGNAALGRAIVVEQACGVCHEIPGIAGADGIVGPPLRRFALRPLIAGKIPNTPDMLIAWLDDPPALDPETAMPDVGLDRTTARDVAAFLATLR